MAQCMRMQHVDEFSVKLFQPLLDDFAQSCSDVQDETDMQCRIMVRRCPEVDYAKLVWLHRRAIQIL